MVVTPVGPADVGFLLTVVGNDDDARCRLDALRAMAALPLDAEGAAAALEAAGRGGLNRSATADALDRLELLVRQPAAGAGPVPTGEPDPPDIAARVRGSLLADTFPEDLSALGELDVDTAAHLLTELVEELLGGLDRQVAVARLRRGTRRLVDVLDALIRRGTRPVHAWLPDPALLGVTAADPRWAGGLLALVHPRDLLAVAADAVAADEDHRLDALGWLATAAPLVGRVPTPLVDPLATGGLDDERLALQRLVERARPTERRYRGEFATAAEPPGRDLPTAEPPAAEPSATRRAHARLQADPRVAPGAEFELRVGLAGAPDPGVTASAPFEVPQAEFGLAVTLMADGFEILGDGSATRTVQVTPRDPHPYEVVRLRALDDPRWLATRAIFATYYANGTLIGMASRQVLVDADPAAEPPPEPTGADWPIPIGPAQRPDVEIHIARGNDRAGGLLWQYRSRHWAADRTDPVLPGEFPADVAATVGEFIEGIEDRAGQVDLAPYVRAVSDSVGQLVPDEVWNTLADAHAKVRGAPTVLLTTWDPYLPWELARVPSPWLADAPDVLGAQAVVGRWPYRPPSKDRPPEPALGTARMVVVSGVYPDRLVEAEAEAAALQARYGGTGVAVELAAVIACLEGDPPAEVLHLAAHGTFDAMGTQDGIRMSDGGYLSPLVVRGIGGSPIRLAFLNACQLGQGRTVLGSYAGFAEAMIGNGAQAVIAPLWKVHDAVARAVAVEFYAAVFERHTSPAVFLREQRCATLGKEGTDDGTRLAYVYFGHPLLRVDWKGQVRDA